MINNITGLSFRASITKTSPGFACKVNTGCDSFEKSQKDLQEICKQAERIISNPNREIRMMLSGDTSPEVVDEAVKECKTVVSILMQGINKESNLENPCLLSLLTNMPEILDRMPGEKNREEVKEYILKSLWDRKNVDAAELMLKTFEKI